MFARTYVRTHARSCARPLIPLQSSLMVEMTFRHYTSEPRLNLGCAVFYGVVHDFISAGRVRCWTRRSAAVWGVRWGHTVEGFCSSAMWVCMRAREASSNVSGVGGEACSSAGARTHTVHYEENSGRTKGIKKKVFDVLPRPLDSSSSEHTGTVLNPWAGMRF